jgi:hypothetical protein
MDRDEMSTLCRGRDMSIRGLLLAHLAKGKGRFCHHLASVVCRPLTFLISSSSVDKHGRHRQFLFLIGRFFYAACLAEKQQIPNL